MLPEAHRFSARQQPSGTVVREKSLAISLTNIGGKAAQKMKPGQNLRSFFDSGFFDIQFFLEDKGSGKALRIPGYFQLGVNPKRNAGGIRALDSKHPRSKK